MTDLSHETACLPGQVVVFDLIGVLARPSWRELCVAPDLERWRRLKVGALPESALWTAGQGAAYRAALGLRSDRVALLTRLRARGLTIVIASNFAREWAPTIRAAMPDGLVARWLISGELGVAKPDPGFWAELLRHVAPGTLVVDDQRRNCEAATAAGLRGLWAPAGAGFAARVLAALDAAP
ncbi:MAG TPA: HAD-IA family hydrolase [Nannocystis sp.]